MAFEGITRLAKDHTGHVVVVVGLSDPSSGERGLVLKLGPEMKGI